MRVALMLLVVLALMAGCASAPTSTVKPAAVTPTLAAAPNATENATAVVAMAPPVTVQYDGASPTGACGYGTSTPADTCQFSDGGKEGFHVVAYKGQARSIELSIAYGAVQPGSTFYASICTSKDADPNHATCNDYQTGASPFVLKKDLSSLPPGAAVAISAGSVAIPPTPAGAMLFTPDDFHVKGALTLVPAG
ncbi:MAG: hypothetical protein QOE90_2100 [Thermoplasmata archaeon]|jgi:hypothetical protein|nr:hypothetical protein [Thermoplasmata archaeon]